MIHHEFCSTEIRNRALPEVAALKKLLAGPPHFLGVVAGTKVLLLV